MQDSDVPFNAAQASGPGAAVDFKKRPFGILRYQPGLRNEGSCQWRIVAYHRLWKAGLLPGEGMKGAMAMEIIPKSRYPGDPQGQAFAAGWVCIESVACAITIGI